MKEKLVNVGIFWAVPNKWEGGWSFYEVKKTYQLSDANSLGFIDYPYSHFDVWDKLSNNRFPYANFATYPHLIT